MLVEDWIKAQDAARAGDVSRLKTFINTSLAETWEEQGDRVAAHELQRRAPDIPLGVVTWGHFVRTLGVDVQGDRLEAVRLGLGPRHATASSLTAASSTATPRCPKASPAAPGPQLTEYRRTPSCTPAGATAPARRLCRQRRPPHPTGLRLLRASTSTRTCTPSKAQSISRQGHPRQAQRPGRRTGAATAQTRRQALAHRHRHRQGRHLRPPAHRRAGPRLRAPAASASPPRSSSSSPPSDWSHATSKATPGWNGSSPPESATSARLAPSTRWPPRTTSASTAGEMANGPSGKGVCRRRTYSKVRPRWPHKRGAWGRGTSTTMPCVRATPCGGLRRRRRGRFRCPARAVAASGCGTSLAGIRQI